MVWYTTSVTLLQWIQIRSTASAQTCIVEHQVQRLFFAIAANLDLKVYGGDAKDAFAHLPGPELATDLAIENAYEEWHKNEYANPINQSPVLPILKAL